MKVQKFDDRFYLAHVQVILGKTDDSLVDFRSFKQDVLSERYRIRSGTAMLIGGIFLLGLFVAQVLLGIVHYIPGTTRAAYGNQTGQIIEGLLTLHVMSGIILFAFGIMQLTHQCYRVRDFLKRISVLRKYFQMQSLGDDWTQARNLVDCQLFRFASSILVLETKSSRTSEEDVRLVNLRAEFSWLINMCSGFHGLALRKNRYFAQAEKQLEVEYVI